MNGRQRPPKVGRYGCQRLSRVEYLREDGTLTTKPKEAHRFFHPNPARDWLKEHIPDYAEAWGVVELPEKTCHKP